MTAARDESASATTPERRSDRQLALDALRRLREAMRKAEEARALLNEHNAVSARIDILTAKLAANRADAKAVEAVAEVAELSALTERQIAAKAADILRHLGSERAVAVWGHYARGLTQRKVARATGLSLGTVNATLAALARHGFISIRKRGGINPASVRVAYHPYRQ